MKLKVCGMKYLENIQSVAALQPDYLGFIFYERSKRSFDGMIPELPETIKKTGVFVNETIENVVAKVNKYNLKAIQLHGDESVAYILELKENLCQAERISASHKKKPLNSARGDNSIEIIKVFGIKDEFDFDLLKPYEGLVDYFLFDTKGKERGGNGVVFNWQLLEEYNSEKPFFLSGGIGIEQTAEIKKIYKTDLPIYALDINSRFEIEAGLKDIEKIKQFKKDLLDF